MIFDLISLSARIFSAHTEDSRGRDDNSSKSRRLWRSPDRIVPLAWSLEFI